MSLILRKYADFFSELDVIKNLSPSSRSGAYLISGEDSDTNNLIARLVCSRLAAIPAETALDDCADISVYPLTADAKKAKGKKNVRDGARPAMSVDDVKEIISSLYLTPFSLDLRFYIIENAETMSEICQNKLLKSLEEPPPRVCFILCASGALLPTVESRCISLVVPPFDVEQTARMLGREHKSGDVMLAARASRGNLGMAERILADKDFGSTYSAALKLIKNASGSRNFAHAAAVYEKYTRERIDELLGLTEYLLGDIARLLSGRDTVFDAVDINSVSTGFTPYSAARCCDFVREARRRNTGNGMISALMDEAVLKIMEEKALCRS